MDADEVRNRLEALVAKAKEALDAPPMEPVSVESTCAPVAITQEDVLAQCRTCGGQFTSRRMLNFGALMLQTINCEKCCREYQERNEPARRDTAELRAASWAKLCPAEYLETDEQRVRHEAGDIATDILGWEGGKGMGIIGATGRCKTRLMFLYLRRRHMGGEQIRYINAVKFADELADAYGTGSHDAERWMRDIERSPLLFIDDLGKEKLTERVEVFYYRCAEYRYSEKLPIFFTSNLTGKELQKRWDEAANRGGFWADRAAPTVRRIRERCHSFIL